MRAGLHGGDLAALDGYGYLNVAAKALALAHIDAVGHFRRQGAGVQRAQHQHGQQQCDDPFHECFPLLFPFSSAMACYLYHNIDCFWAIDFSCLKIAFSCYMIVL